MDPIVSLATSSRTVLVPFQRSSGVTSFCAASNAVNLLVTSAANCTVKVEVSVNFSPSCYSIGLRKWFHCSWRVWLYVVSSLNQSVFSKTSSFYLFSNKSVTNQTICVVFDNTESRKKFTQAIIMRCRNRTLWNTELKRLLEVAWFR